MNAFFTAVIADDDQTLLTYFHNGQANVKLAYFGTISNNRIFKMFLSKVAHRFQKLNVSAEFVCQQEGNGVMVAEYNLVYSFYDWERKSSFNYETPTALVCAMAEDGTIESMTVYTGMDKFVGKEIIRPAFMNAVPALAEAMPAAVKACYEEEKTVTLTEPCCVHAGNGWVAVEENVLKTKGAVCTPQAQLSVFVLNEDQTVLCRRVYGEIVWDFKLWPTLF